MQSRLPRSVWAVLVAVYAMASLAVLIFMGSEVAPCLGGPGPQQDELRRLCAEHWFASRPLWDKLFNSPLLAVAIFVALVVVTAWLARVRTPGPNQAE